MNHILHTPLYTFVSVAFSPRHSQQPWVHGMPPHFYRYANRGERRCQVGSRPRSRRKEKLGRWEKRYIIYYIIYYNIIYFWWIIIVAIDIAIFGGCYCRVYGRYIELPNEAYKPNCNCGHHLLFSLYIYIIEQPHTDSGVFAFFV